MPEKILFDTDIGTDIDDAVCLAYLLAQPECELMGITTVSGEPEKRAMIASALCKAAKKDIPIFAGAENPLINPIIQKYARQAEALSKWDHDEIKNNGEAIEFMRKTIRENPGEITLLAVGPLTNVALLFAADREIPHLLKRLVLMCGAFTCNYPAVNPSEWNARNDPHAAKIVYQAPVKIHRSIGLDVTRKVVMDAEMVGEKFQVGLLRTVLDFAEVWFRESAKIITFHDPLAAVTIFNNEVCEFSRGNVDVEIVSPKSFGFTYWRPDQENGVHEVALKVDSNKFFEEYFSVFKK